MDEGLVNKDAADGDRRLRYGRGPGTLRFPGSRHFDVDLEQTAADGQLYRVSSVGSAQMPRRQEKNTISLSMRSIAGTYREYSGS